MENEEIKKLKNPRQELNRDIVVKESRPGETKRRPRSKRPAEETKESKFTIRMTAEERKYLEDEMSLTGAGTLSAYIRSALFKDLDAERREWMNSRREFFGAVARYEKSVGNLLKVYSVKWLGSSAVGREQLEYYRAEISRLPGAMLENLERYDREGAAGYREGARAVEREAERLSAFTPVIKKLTGLAHPEAASEFAEQVRIFFGGTW